MSEKYIAAIYLSEIGESARFFDESQLSVPSLYKTDPIH